MEARQRSNVRAAFRVGTTIVTRTDSGPGPPLEGNATSLCRCSSPPAGSCMCPFPEEAARVRHVPEGDQGRRGERRGSPVALERSGYELQVEARLDREYALVLLWPRSRMAKWANG